MRSSTPERNSRALRVKGRNHFAAYAEEGNHFVNQVARLLHCSRNQAARITRAVLHGMRDKMPVKVALSFAQGLPLALKAVFTEGYDISNKPVRLRRSLDFLDYVYCLEGPNAGHDLPTEARCENAVVAVYIVLSRYMDEGQLNMIRQHLGKHMVKILELRSRAFLD